MQHDWRLVVNLHVEAAIQRSCGEGSDARLTVMMASVAWPEAFERIARAAKLSDGERLVIACLVAAQIDPVMAARMEGLSSGTRITRGALASIVYSELSASAIAAFDSHGALSRLGLIELEDVEADGSAAWARRAVRASDRILGLFFGANTVDDRVAGVISLPELSLGIDDLVLGSETLASVSQDHSEETSVIVFTGHPGTGRRTLTRALAMRAARKVLEVDAGKLAKDHAAMTKQLKLIARECILLGRVPLVRNIDALVDDKDQTRVDLVGSELASEIDGPVFVTCGVNRPAMRWGRPTIVIDVKPPTSEQRAKLWLRELGQGTDEDGEYLASQYPLAPALIHHAAKVAKARANGKRMQPEDIYAGVRAVLDDRLGDFAKRVEVTQTWEDLVLPPDQIEAIAYLIARIRQRRTVYEQWGFAAKVGKGLGTTALFSGPPGTGKTMVAALIAQELGLELYQVDMAKVVSKWIGETERNLAALFDAAEAGHAILLFDEADSLFGKRTEVKSSNDRYANLETNYLLQRLESFTGICLLTSNHESNIDPAFQRRMSLHLRFELPEADERAALWRAMLPPAAPVAPDIDANALAHRFAMSGGYIRNAALRAAFLAADEGSAITNAHLERAALLEYEGMGKIAYAG